MQSSSVMVESKTVLIADDEPSIRDLIIAVLEIEGDYHLLTASDGEEALKIALDTKPNLVLLDIVMPKLDGWQVCKKLKANKETARTKVVMLTGLGQGSHKRKSWGYGADAYLQKPLSTKVLAQKVKELLES